MIELETVKNTENIIKKILSDRIAETDDLNNQLIKTNDLIESATLEMKKATTIGDEKAYIEAKAKKREAEDKKEMHGIRLDQLNNKPLISKNDYEKLVSDILNEIKTIDDQKKKKLAKLSEQMSAESEELKKAITKANEVLRRLQNEVYRNADRSKDNDGNIRFTSFEDKRIENFETVEWGLCGIKTYQYEKETGKKYKYEMNRLFV